MKQEKNCGNFFLTGLAIAYLLLLYPSRCHAQDYSDCSECHDVTLSGKVVHPILRTAGCVACHTEAHERAAKQKRFLSAKGAELCFGCHDKKNFSHEVKHPPVAEGQCLSCHDPHMSENPHLLIKNIPELCFNCHSQAKFENRSVHSPVAGGNCASCHTVHGGSVKKLLLKPAPDLCFLCHDSRQFSGVKTVHAHVDMFSCDQCHSPHAGRGDKLLHLPKPELCFRCHL